MDEVKKPYELEIREWKGEQTLVARFNGSDELHTITDIEENPDRMAKITGQSPAVLDDIVQEANALYEKAAVAAIERVEPQV